jgi:peptidoglycan/LPS O-acetylase OafA/YrhL
MENENGQASSLGGADRKIRLPELDSVRGIAAATVVLGHFVGALSDTPPWWFDHFMPPGHSAVVLFFVLSGYVLSIPFWRGRQDPYPKYLLRRFFRIYVPYAAAVSCALIGATKMNGIDLPLSHYFYQTWHTPVTVRMALAQFFQISTSPAIGTAFWSLRYEMEISLIFPVLCSLFVSLRARGTFVLACMCALVGQALSHFHRTFDATNELGVTLVWSTCFILGALISWKARKITLIFQRIPLLGRITVAILTYVAYLSSRNLIIIPAAVSMVILIENSQRLKLWLNTSVCHYLGRISYSLYLTHGTVLFTLLILLYGKIPVFLLLIAFLAVSLGVAHLFCICVEEPAMRLGKRLTQSKTRAGASFAVMSEAGRHLQTESLSESLAFASRQVGPVTIGSEERIHILPG